MATKGHATVDDLYRVEGKAELVNGELVLMSPSGARHGRIVLKIVASLLAYEARTHAGYTLPDNVGFIVNLPNRRSFSPDAAFCAQPMTDKFVDGAPVFAVEVRSPDDYGPTAERSLAAKRADYVAAGTKVVWDVDVRESLLRVHRASEPGSPQTFRRGEYADAEPAVPGWSLSVDDLFAE